MIGELLGDNQDLMDRISAAEIGVFIRELQLLVIFYRSLTNLDAATRTPITSQCSPSFASVMMYHCGCYAPLRSQVTLV